MTSQGRLRRLDQQLGAHAADAEPQELEAFVEVDDARLVLIEDQPPGRQPLGQQRLDLLGLGLAVAQGDEIVGVPDQHRRVTPQLTGMNAAALVTDPGGLFHPVQRHVQQQGADHPALGSSLLGWAEPTLLDHARLQPALDLFPGRERAEMGEEPVMVDPVERRCQVRVEHPPTARVRTPRHMEDGLDRVMAATTRAEAVGLRLEPRLLLGLQRVDHLRLGHAVHDHREFRAGVVSRSPSRCTPA